MNKALYSGVAGLKTHQIKMDVIGNNISNVNTYGYKSQRAVFADMYYQNVRDAAAGDSNRGGINPSSVGYGTSLASIQTLMTTTGMHTTGHGLDVSVVGEGFLQVMDGSGNIFYTKAGMLAQDPSGYLVDINGNFVLGVSGEGAEAGTQRIKLDNIGAVAPSSSSNVQSANGIDYTMSTSNSTHVGNVSVSLVSSENLPAGEMARAIVSNTGAIAIQLNAFHTFTDQAQLNKAINDAITEANGGEQHPAGEFTLESAGGDKFAGLTGAQIGGTSYGTELGEIEGFGAGAFGGLMDFIKTSNEFKGIGDIKPEDFTATFSETPEQWEISMKVTDEDGIEREYTALIKEDTKEKSLLLKTDDGAGGTIEVSNPGFEELTDFYKNSNLGVAPLTDSVLKSYENTATVDRNAPTGDASTTNGFGPLIKTIKLSQGFNPTANAVASGFTAKYNVGIDAKAQQDAVAAGNAVPPGYTNRGANIAAIAAQLVTDAGETVPDTYYNLTGADIPAYSTTTPAVDYPAVPKGTKFPADYKAETTIAAHAGQLKVDTGEAFPSGYINTTGVEMAAVTEVKGVEAYIEFSMTIDDQPYTGKVTDGDTNSTLVLSNASTGRSVEINNPGFDALKTAMTVDGAAGPVDDFVLDYNGDATDLVNIIEFEADTTPAKNLTTTPSIPSKDIGLAISFLLGGGTEGGAVTMHELNQISIGPDGTILVTHPEKGTVIAGKISLATFTNPSGLQLSGASYYAVSANSGDPIVVNPGTKGTGELKSGGLEMSNVDLSGEFAEMITTQRGFQAASRMITVSDTMLEELINLKR